MEAAGASSPIPALLVLGPILASFLVRQIGRRSEKARDLYCVGVAALTFVGAVALVPLVRAHGLVSARIPLMLGQLTFGADAFAMLFGLFTTLIWMLATLYAVGYMRHEHKRDRYHMANLALLGANLGVVFAADLATLYLFFEALGLAAFWVVVHTETIEAKKASVKYLWMTVVGGLALVAGILISYGLGSTGTIAPIPAAEGMDAMRWAAALLMILGFGVKAGMVPVHVWLPDAHPVAPSPASALLSGVMIKAGAYGIFRVVGALFRPPVLESIPEEAWHFTSQIGFVILWIGMVTMFVGVVLALLQENAKRMLAYHSVSQMGFILAGLGAAGYLGPEGAMGFAGGLFHVLNHALFKAALFLGVGAVFFRTGELNMYKLGGLWKRMPLTFLFTLIAALGITGVPLFNGYISKCLIHHAIVEAYELHEVVSLKAAEILYIVTCGGTVCSFIKLIGFVFLGKPKRDLSDVKEAPASMLVPMGVLALMIAAVGLAPRVVIDGVFVAGLHTWGLESRILEQVRFFTLENLQSLAYAFAIGIGVFVVGVRFGLFHLRFPAWASIDSWYQRSAKAVLRVFSLMARAYDAWLATVAAGLRRSRAWYARTVARTKRGWDCAQITILAGAPRLRQRRCLDRAYVVLARERVLTVRDAVSACLPYATVTADRTPRERQAYVDAVRDVAAHMATRLFAVRIAVAGTLVQSHRADDVITAIDTTAPDLPKWRAGVIATALREAPERLEGVSVARAVAHATNELLSAERYDQRLLGLMPARRAQAAGVQPAVGVRRGLVEREIEAARVREGRLLATQERLAAWVAEADAAGGSVLAALGRFSEWLLDVVRIAVEVVTEEHVPWMIEERVDRESVVATRRAIQRYARDISLSVGVLVCVFVAFVLALVLKLG